MANNSECNADSQRECLKYMALYKATEYYVLSTSHEIAGSLTRTIMYSLLQVVRLYVLKYVKQGTTIFDTKM
jgi:hypothetical protein